MQSAAIDWHDISGVVNVLTGSWRISCNRADTGAALCFDSTRSIPGEKTIRMVIPASNTYAGNVNLTITSEAAGAHSPWQIYGARVTPNAVVLDSGGFPVLKGSRRASPQKPGVVSSPRYPRTAAISCWSS